MNEQDISPEMMAKLVESRKLIEALEIKLENGEEMSYYEIKQLGLWQSYNNELLTLDEKLKPYKFKELYQIFKDDLTFSSEYYKRGWKVKITDIITYEELTSLNSKEYNANESEKIFAKLKTGGVLIKMNEKEICEARNYLEQVAIWWGEICLNETNSDPDIIEIIGETKKNIKLKKIKEYAEGLKNENSHSVFLGLLKSYYVFCESKLIFERIVYRGEPTSYRLNNSIIHFTFNTAIHIIYRHFAQMVSWANLVAKKSFHSTKIDPYKLNLLFESLIENIEQSGVYRCMEISTQNPIHLRFHGGLYTMFLTYHKLDGCKLIISTFYEVDRVDDIKEILNLTEVKISDNLSVFTKLEHKKNANGAS